MMNTLKKTLIAMILCFCVVVGYAQDHYKSAWQAIRENNLSTAKDLLLKALNEPSTRIDACMTLILLEDFESRQGQTFEHVYTLYKKKDNLNPYIYAKWFEESMLGEYGKKAKSNLQFINDLLKDPNTHPSMVASLRYMLGMHFLSSNQFDKAVEEWKKVGNIDKWQLVGPFENISGSGFDKNYLPISSPKENTEFVSLHGAKIFWFTPQRLNNDAWIFVNNFIASTTAVTYAQSFVYVPQDMEAVVNLGGRGSMKVWVNDKLHISEEEERLTELDVFKAKCKLKKGYNRILVQLGYTYEDYANFIVRLTDSNLQPIQGISYSDKYQEYPVDKNEESVQKISLFAEDFFIQKIQENPENPIHYILLSNTYRRNKKIVEARGIMQKAFQKDPENVLLRTEYLLVLLKSENRTEILKQVNEYKEKYPESYTMLYLKMDELLKEEKLTEAEAVLNKIISKYGENEELLEKKMQMAILLKREQDLINMIYRHHEKYPENPLFTSYYFALQQQVNKNTNSNLKILENFLKNKYNYNITNSLIKLYFQQGMTQKAIKTLEKMEKYFPHQSEFSERLGKYYHATKNYKKSLEYINKCIAQAPYMADNWLSYASTQEVQYKTSEALEGYKKALLYNPNDYDTRNKIRSLENKRSLQEVLPSEEIYEMIKNNQPKPEYKDFDWYYILDEKNKILYSGGGAETYITSVVRVLNQKGIDYWRESSIGYNGYTERLIVEKAEILKKNSKINAEVSGNELVFSNLEIGDVIVIKYKIESYARGRFAKEFWDVYNFSAYVPCEKSRYSLLSPKDKKIQYKFFNSQIEPSIKDVEDYNLYVWEASDLKAIKYEKYGPHIQEQERILQISTLNSWQDIASWYADLSAHQAKQDYEVNQVFDEIFPQGFAHISKLERAKTIYNYIIKNIQYSSIPFRQSAYVPQKASKTLSTKLGDCKDVSTLFASLAHKADIPVNLQLVGTRDNGESFLQLPSLMFNHCIVKANIDNKDYYLELTSPYLPFGALPLTVERSLILDIPSGNQQTESKIQVLMNPPNKNLIARKKTIKIEKMDLVMEVKTIKTGYAGADMRESYTNENPEKQKERISKAIAYNTKNPISEVSLQFEDIEKITDSLKYTYKYTVKNEVAEIGALHVFKVPYSDRYGQVDLLPEESRVSALDLSRFEGADEYAEEIMIEIPAGKVLVDIPKNLTLKNEFMQCEFKFTKINPTTLRVEKKIINNRNTMIAPKDYRKFREALIEVNNLENKYITYK